MAPDPKDEQPGPADTVSVSSYSFQTRCLAVALQTWMMYVRELCTCFFQLFVDPHYSKQIDLKRIITAC
jgi:hypothetical protein